MSTTAEALVRLREGNHRFASGASSDDLVSSAARRRELLSGQEPFAIIVGCADSRVSPEIIFDQPLGELFVIRIAGNTVATSQLSSIEFAAARLGTRLVVVLGHSHCGAVTAAMEAVRATPHAPALYPQAIIEAIRPALEEIQSADPNGDPEALLARAIRANVLRTAERIRHELAGSELLEPGDNPLVIGAEYSLETGAVEFFEGVPASG